MSSKVLQLGEKPFLRAFYLRRDQPPVVHEWTRATWGEKAKSDSSWDRSFSRKLNENLPFLEIGHLCYPIVRIVKRQSALIQNASF